jgi:transposase-like protein
MFDDLIIKPKKIVYIPEHCPTCNSKDIEYVNSKLTKNHFYKTIRCKYCHAQWTEHYNNHTDLEGITINNDYHPI